MVLRTADKLDILLGREPFAIGDLILTELLQGFSDGRAFTKYLGIPTVCYLIEASGYALTSQAVGDARCACERRARRTIPKLMIAL